jgi:hypothetical protein
MKGTLLTATAAALMALGGVSYAATTTNDHTANTTQHTTTKADTSNKNTTAEHSKLGTEIDKAVGGGDTITAADMKSAMSLSKVKDAKDKLASAKVDDPKGNVIGPVKEVITGKTGTPTAIHVDVGGWLGVGERVVSMKPSNFTYIPDRGILVTKMSKAAIEKLPAVKSKST